MTNKKAWKVLEKGMKSMNGNVKWKKGQWQHYEGKLRLCNSGFHASKLLVDAIQYVTPGIICRVEYKGETITGEDKFVCSDMCVIETYHFTKRMAIEFAIFCARLCLKNFEDRIKDDDRPRKAIEAAEKYLKNPTQKNKDAAESATWSATWSAVWSAWAAAESAARSATKVKMEKKLLEIIGVK